MPIARWKKVVLAAVYLPAALVFYVLGYRLIQITHPDRIGHLAGEIDCLLKEVKLDRLGRHRGVLLASRDATANARLVDYWAQYLHVVRSPTLCRLFWPLGYFRFTRYRADMSRYFTAIGGTAAASEILSTWDTRPPLLKLSRVDLDRGNAMLLRLGLPSGGRFI